MNVKRVEYYFFEGNGMKLLMKCLMFVYIFYDDSKVYEKIEFFEIFVVKCMVDSEGEFSECKNFVLIKVG